MAVPFSAAANAYGAVQRLIGDAAALNPQAGQQAVAGPDFAALLQQGVGNVLEAGARADTQSMNLVSGNANVVDVVTAISETEIALETLVTVRDKVISAYEEIMRMPI
jgi:flagellar hook-basal body complex protein FliE